jgi:hypothetical protein
MTSVGAAEVMEVSAAGSGRVRELVGIRRFGCSACPVKIVEAGEVVLA